MATKTNTPNVSFETWKKMVDDQLARLTSMYQEAERYERQGVEQGNAAIDELSRLMKDSLNYSSQIAAGWRQVQIENTQRAVEMYRNLTNSVTNPNA